MKHRGIVLIFLAILLLVGNAAAVAPVADFNATNTSGESPLYVQFSDLSTGEPTEWYWSFGDGYVDTVQNPAHTYSYDGNFTVYLMATNADGNDTLIRNGYIQVSSTIPSTTSEQNVRYWATPHHVKITTKSIMGVPIKDAEVTAIYVETSGPLDWLYNWIGIPVSNQSVQNTTLLGHTGDDGSVDFMLVESVQYNITAFKIGEIHSSMTIYPKDDEYTMWVNSVNGSTMFAQGYNQLDVIKFETNGTEINSTHGRIFTGYTDMLAQTTFATIQVNRTVSIGNLTTEVGVANYTSYASGNFTHNFDLPDTRDHSYVVRLRASGTIFANVSRDFGVTFPPGPISFGIPENLLPYVGMLGLFFIGLLFTRSLPGPAALTIMFFGWVFFFMHWWRDLAPEWMIAIALIFFTLMAIIFNVMLRSKKQFFG